MLLGQRTRGVPEYHHFFPTGTRPPIAVTAGDVGTAGPVIFSLAIDFFGPGGNGLDHIGYLMGYVPDGAGNYDAVERDLSTGDGCHQPTIESHQGDAAVAQLRPGGLPSVALASQRGLCLVHPANLTAVGFAMAEREHLFLDDTISAVAAVPSAAAGVDDLVHTADDGPVQPVRGRLRWRRCRRAPRLHHRWPPGVCARHSRRPHWL